jgi:glycogen synthase
MRICLVTSELAGVTDYTGGIGHQYAMLVPELCRQGHELDVVTWRPRRAGILPRLGAELHLIPQPKSNALRVPAFARALGALGGFDVVIAPEYAASAFQYSAHKHAGPLVSHLHSPLALISRHWRLVERALPRVVLQQRLEGLQVRRSDGIVAASRAVLSATRRLWHVEHVPAIVSHNGIELSRVRSLAGGEPPDGFPESDPVVLFTGRLQPAKGVDVLVRAMRRVWERHPDCQLVTLGADLGWGRTTAEEHLLALAGPDARRLLSLGPQPLDRLLPAIARADVVALPSRWETWSQAILEALALGRPLVATAGSGADEAVESGRQAITVRPGDVVELANAIETLLGDAALRERMGQAAAERAGDFDLAVAARRFTTAVEDLARGAGG